LFGDIPNNASFVTARTTAASGSFVSRR
jgi:hypothetical protein